MKASLGSSLRWSNILMVIVMTALLLYNGILPLTAQDRRNNLKNFIVSLNTPSNDSPVIQRKKQIEKNVWNCIKRDSFFKHQKDLHLYFVLETWSDASFLTDKSYRDYSFLYHLNYEFNNRWFKIDKKASFAGYVLIVDNQGKYLGKYYQGRLWQNYNNANVAWNIDITLSKLLFTHAVDYVFYYSGLPTFYLCIRESDVSLFVLESTKDGSKRYSWDEALDKWGVSRVE